MVVRPPPTQLTCPQFPDLKEGAERRRVHLTTFGASEFNPGSGGSTRFAPFKDVDGMPVPPLHASAGLRAAIHETIFHDIPAGARTGTVRRDEVSIRTHSQLRTNRPLRLVELGNVTLGRWGIWRRDLITSGPASYGQTVLRAAAVHRDIPDADGLVWSSSQCDPDDACLFCGDRVNEHDFTAVLTRDGSVDSSFVEDVRAEGRPRGITLAI